MDNNVDLTLERKFRKDFFPVRFKGVSAALREQSNKCESFLFKRSELLPWNKRRYEESSKIPPRYYDNDEFSQNMNVLIRLTEGNTVLYFGEHAPTDKLVKEELWMEVLGRLPYNSANTCPYCGKVSICSSKEQFQFKECKKHNTGIPRKWLVDL